MKGKVIEVTQTSALKGISTLTNFSTSCITPGLSGSLEHLRDSPDADGYFGISS